MDEENAELQGTGSGRTELCMAVPFLLCFPEHPFVSRASIRSQWHYYQSMPGEVLKVPASEVSLC